MVFFAFALAIVLLAIVITLLLRRQLSEKYATLWLIISVLVLILAIFPGLLDGLTAVLGVQVPSNLLFSLAIVLLLGVGLHLSWELSRAEDELRRVAEEAAIARSRIDRLEDRLRRLDGPTDSADAEPGPDADHD
ncbi:DUF2304 domain-containing protein [Agromyces intestinalis]|uniref:DUF2304 domain-containing protein n=1 Tax=Agromyces intestinalis TaxID=2592652 RepID=A0A5C1YD35_9MICO|nr:DUF2304 domain-containing protein [Agromyces intestinalis]QEO13538.1 DUF2304 domain-containing protein [Agromyces intestinalis]